MPKNGNRSDNAKKVNVSFTPNNEEIDSNVVFGDANPKKKTKRGSTTDDSAKKGGDIVPALGSGPSKKSDTKKLVSNIQGSFDCCQDESICSIAKRLLSSNALLANCLKSRSKLTSHS